MTHQDVDDASVLPGLLAQIAADVLFDTIGGDGAYDKKHCHAAMAARGAMPSIPPREGANPWSERTPGASWRNEAIGDIARDGRRECKKRSGYHRRSLVENTMYRYKTLTGNRLWARRIGSQATEMEIRVGVLNAWRRLHVLSPSESYEFAVTGEAASSRSIYATTPPVVIPLRRAGAG